MKCSDDVLAEANIKQCAGNGDEIFRSDRYSLVWISGSKEYSRLNHPHSNGFKTVLTVSGFLITSSPVRFSACLGRANRDENHVRHLKEKNDTHSASREAAFLSVAGARRGELSAQATVHHQVIARGWSDCIFGFWAGTLLHGALASVMNCRCVACCCVNPTSSVADRDKPSLRTRRSCVSESTNVLRR